MAGAGGASLVLVVRTSAVLDTTVLRWVKVGLEIDLVSVSVVVSVRPGDCVMVSVFVCSTVGAGDDVIVVVLVVSDLRLRDRFEELRSDEDFLLELLRDRLPDLPRLRDLLFDLDFDFFRGKAFARKAAIASAALDRFFSGSQELSVAPKPFHFTKYSNPLLEDFRSPKISAIM